MAEHPKNSIRRKFSIRLTFDLVKSQDLVITQGRECLGLLLLVHLIALLITCTVWLFFPFELFQLAVKSFMRCDSGAIIYML